MKKSLLITSLLATSFLACGVAAMNNVSAKAETADFATAFGASVRVSDPNGIRFKLQLSEEKKNEIFAENSGKELGMYILLGSKAGTDYSALTQKIELEFEEKDLYKEGNAWYANGVMTNLYVQSFNKEFVGVGYIATTTAEGTTYEYSAFNAADNVRSMSGVAIEAYKAEDNQDAMVALIEKAAYAEYGVVETRTTAEGVINYTFAKGEDSWTSYAAMQEAIPVSIAVTEGNLLVGETLDLGAALSINGTKLTKLDVPFTYAVEGEAVTLKDGVVTATGAGEANVTVSFGKWNKTVAINVQEKAVVETQVRNHLQGHPDVNMFGQTATVSLVKKQGNFNGFGSIEGEIQSLSLSNGTNLSEIENLTVELVNNELIFTTTESSLVNVLGEYRGSKTVVLTTNVYEGETLKKVITHNFYMTFADYVFTTYTEIREFSSKLVDANTVTDDFVTQRLSNSICTNGYFVLGNDIKFNSTNVLNANNPYKPVSLIGGTFDGQGYTLISPKFYNCALLGVVRNGATIKDMNITGGTVAFGTTETSSASNAGIIAWIAGKGTTISNVHAEVKLDGYAKTTKSDAAFGFVMRMAPFGSGNFTISDCSMIIKTSTLKAVGTGVGVWCGQGFNTSYVFGTSGTLMNVTMKNCISVIADSNEYGCIVNEVSPTAYGDFTKINCNYFTNWTAYNEATLEGYKVNMLSFIESCK